MSRRIEKNDEHEVCERVARALEEPASDVSLLRGYSGDSSDVTIIAIRGVPIQSPRLVATALADEGISRGPTGWEIADDEPAFPADGGIERPLLPPGWYPTFYVPERATCPFCDAPVIPCDARRPDGPPCPHARWKPAPSAHGARFAHTECVEAAEVRDGAAKACREWEGAKAEEVRAWELAKLATELRLRAEKTYQEAMAAEGKVS